MERGDKRKSPVIPRENTSRSGKIPKSVRDSQESRGSMIPAQHHGPSGGVVTPQGRNLFRQSSSAFDLVYRMHFMQEKDSVAKIWKLLYKTMSWWLYILSILYFESRLNRTFIFQHIGTSSSPLPSPCPAFMLSTLPSLRLCAWDTAPCGGTLRWLCHSWILLPVLPLFPS